MGVELAEYLGSQTRAAAAGSSRGQRFVGREAALALGAMANRQQDSEVTAVAVGVLHQMMSSTRDVHALRPAFALLSGIGDPSLLALAVPATRDSNPELREAAAASIRAMRPAATTQFTSSWLRREQNWNVKRKLYRTIHKQILDHQVAVDGSVLEQAIFDLQSQPDIISRRALIQIIGQSAETSDAARRTLLTQLAIEARSGSGLYGAVAKFLDPHDVRDALQQ